MIAGARSGALQAPRDGKTVQLGPGIISIAIRTDITLGALQCLSGSSRPIFLRAVPDKIVGATWSGSMKVHFPQRPCPTDLRVRCEVNRGLL